MQHRQNVLDVISDQKIEVEVAANELEPFHVVDQRAKRVPEVLDIRKKDRLSVTAKLDPGDLLDHFFKRSDAPGIATKASAISNILRLRSCMSRVTTRLSAPANGVLASDEKLGNDAGHVATVIQHDLAIAPIMPTEPPPKTRPMPFRRKDCPEGAAAFNVGRIGAGPEPQ